MGGTFGVVSPIKSIQRGVYAGAGGDVSISAVVMSKTMVLSSSKSSAGYVAARGDITGSLTPSGGGSTVTSGSGSTINGAPGGFPSYSGTRSLAAGTTDLTVKVYSAKLKDATNITCDGPVEWQVIEFV